MEHWNEDMLEVKSRSQLLKGGFDGSDESSQWKKDATTFKGRISRSEFGTEVEVKERNPSTYASWRSQG